jgi:lipopolysaccharide export system protein LptC
VAMTGTADENLPRRSGKERVAAMRAAMRHTLLVRILRVLLPATALFLVGAVIASMALDPRVQIAVQLDAESVGVSGSRIVMQRPRVTGYGDAADKAKNRGYELMAARAEQDMSKPNEADLFEIEGRMGLRTDGWAEIVAQAGHMNNTTQMLDLYNQIEIKTDLGERARFTQGKIDFVKGEIISNEPVAIRFTQADLFANNMHLFAKGEQAVFTGRVGMILKPDPKEPVTPTDPAAAP